MNRAFISGTLRLVYTVKFYETSDFTYTLCGMALWCIAELTFVILVFCAPSIPRILRDNELISKFFASIRSWARTSFRISPPASNNDSRDKTGRANRIFPIPHLGKTYQRVNENAFPLGNLTAPEYPPPNSLAHNHMCSNRESDAQIQPEGIIRTIEFDATEERQNDNVAANKNKFKLPWDPRFS